MRDVSRDQRGLDVDDLIEREALSDAARKVLFARQDRNRLLKDPAWAALNEAALLKVSAELGWLGLCVPEQYGGLQQPFNALATLYGELGRALAGPCVMAAAIGLELLSQSATSPAVSELIEEIIFGQKLALSVGNGRMAIDVSVHGASLLLNGSVHELLGAGQATHLLIPIAQAQPALALVSIDHPGISLVARKSWDLTRAQVFEVSFDQVELSGDALILQGPAAKDAMLRAAAHFDLALACDAIGGSEQILGETLAYMHTRTQFGRSIASFQALKHRCADLATDIEVARALVDASCEGDDELASWRTQAASCRLLAGAVYRRVSEESVQLHGGIGFTWEQPCHLFLKRARLNDALGGSAAQRKDQAARHMLAAAWHAKPVV
ncbi:Acyl-CoA dehydrogenase [Pseudomonas sp. NFACC15-1]|nr:MULTISPECIES: acyl-CoA dehydrogenase family protein [unclassified Pseudomonas]SCW99108.1 Acyl-CoA dehydrogenase [Pseudomonas sp. NFACC56-3]SDA50789.1 Acyl-CoA dehydrogenase [Pseudomonas sp. NFACC15-1]SDW83643.1 Acyl-CoA dehydrogenase [Pseudomonas sp. NFACC14]SFK88015.1 Acyl-CoA dehydrogenase [Pseudomonas sp. NFACC52]